MEYVQLVDEHTDEINNPDMIACVHAVANYGHYAQRFLARYSQSPWRLGTDCREMTQYYPDMNDADAATRALHRQKPSVEGYGKDSLNVTCSLGLDTHTNLDVYLAPKDEGGVVTVSSTQFGTSGTSCDAELQDDGRWRVRVEGLKAYELNDELHIEGMAGGNRYIVWVSPLHYASIVLAGNYNGLYKDAMAALYTSDRK